MLYQAVCSSYPLPFPGVAFQSPREPLPPQTFIWSRPSRQFFRTSCVRFPPPLLLVLLFSMVELTSFLPCGRWRRSMLPDGLVLSFANPARIILHKYDARFAHSLISPVVSYILLLRPLLIKTVRLLRLQSFSTASTRRVMLLSGYIFADCLRSLWFFSWLLFHPDLIFRFFGYADLSILVKVLSL